MDAAEALSKREVQQLRIELREVERRARSLRGQLKAAGGIRRSRDHDLSRRVTSFLDDHADLAFSPADVRHGIGTDGDVAKLLWSLADAGRIARPERGMYRSLNSTAGGASTA